MKPELLLSGVFLILVDTTGINGQPFPIIDLEADNTISNETTTNYAYGVKMGIINPEKYTLESFDQDERKTFKRLYHEYTSLNLSHSVNYQEWLVQNNFGILADTQESLLRVKSTRRSSLRSRIEFVNTVKKGDILISGYTRGGLVGHAALMTSDYWVLEMRGGSDWKEGIPSNNRQLAKDEWYSKYDSDWIIVYRFPKADIAKDAAVWADRNYYNPSGGSTKEIHITYYITEDMWRVDPSYDSKLVLQAYYFGSGKKKVTRDLFKIDHVVSPVKVPKYFCRKCKLMEIGEF